MPAACACGRGFFIAMWRPTSRRFVQAPQRDHRLRIAWMALSADDIAEDQTDCSVVPHRSVGTDLAVNSADCRGSMGASGMGQKHPPNPNISSDRFILNPIRQRPGSNS